MGYVSTVKQDEKIVSNPLPKNKEINSGRFLKKNRCVRLSEALDSSFNICSIQKISSTMCMFDGMMRMFNIII